MQETRLKNGGQASEPECRNRLSHVSGRRCEGEQSALHSFSILACLLREILVLGDAGLEIPALEGGRGVWEIPSPLCHVPEIQVAVVAVGVPAVPRTRTRRLFLPRDGGATRIPLGQIFRPQSVSEAVWRRSDTMRAKRGALSSPVDDVASCRGEELEALVKWAAVKLERGGRQGPCWRCLMKETDKASPRCKTIRKVSRFLRLYNGPKEHYNEAGSQQDGGPTAHACA